MNNLWTDIGYHSLNKFGEQICGDRIDVVHQDDESVVVVLADGLGSGVKANILSTLTAKIISTMMAQSMPLEDCVETLAATLPVCKTRQIAYSTFTIIRVTDNREAEIIQYDNPHVVLLRRGRHIDFPETAMEIAGKTIYKSHIEMREDDALIAFSDGAVHAGVGKTLNFGWQRGNIISYMETMYERSYTAKTLTSVLLDQCNRLYEGEPGDDATVCTIKIRPRKPMNLMIGPPANPGDVNKMMSLFFSKEGQHIVCGGTTSTLAAQHLGNAVEPLLEYPDPEVPPIAKIKGVDLVTEGVITINKVLTYAQEYINGSRCFLDFENKKDGASRIARMLFEEATDINFFVGRAVNPAHQNPDLPIGFSIKMRLIDRLSECLKAMGKKIKVSYF